MPLPRHLALIPLLLSLSAAPVRPAQAPPAHPLTIRPASTDDWKAVGYLNAADNGTSRTFEVFLADWYAQSPQKHKPFIRKLAENLGINSIPR